MNLEEAHERPKLPTALRIVVKNVRIAKTPSSFGGIKRVKIAT
jgi:hypothetical protein